MQKREVSLSEKCEKSLKSGQTAVHILCLFTVLLHTDYRHGFGFSGQTAQAQCIGYLMGMVTLDDNFDVTNFKILLHSKFPYIF